MIVLAVKALLAPSFVVAASLLARRFGPWVGGVVGGLPVVAGPILLAYALEHGAAFAQHAAAGTLLGLLSLTAFVVVYGRLARGAPWFICMLCGWLAFALGTLALDGVAMPVGLALALACAGFAVGLLLLPAAGAAHRSVIAPPPAWDIPLRAACALALVLALTTASGWLGPQLSGLLAPFPVITTVLATFTHAQRGGGEAVRLLRGMLSGFLAFALFCFTLAISLQGVGVAAGFLLATAVALTGQTAMISRVRRSAGAGGVGHGRGTAAEAEGRFGAAEGHAQMSAAETHSRPSAAEA
ncbi:MAG TPA: hypothetical protein VID70_01345 [Solirubrobacteraceae bacterium]